MSDAPALANDKFSAQLRSTWIASPADTTLQVTAVPTNLPTIVALGWKTDFETIFRVEGVSGTNSSNYALTGVTRLKGANENLPEGLALNCLNNEEYFNQYGDLIAAVQVTADAAQASADAAADSALVATSITSSATPTPVRSSQRSLYEVNALAATGAFQAPTGTAKDGDVLLVRIIDNGTARALTWSATGYTAGGSDLPTATVTGKYLHIGFMYVTSNSFNKWMCLGVEQQA